MQRELSVGSLDDVKKSLLLNALGRFPVVLLYSAMGILVAAFVLLTPEFRAQIPAEHPDWMVPLFIVNYLPHGLIGLLFIAILAAGMSSLDSALNSMSAATMRDIYRPYFKPQADEGHYLRMSKVFTVFWGIFCIVFAFIVPKIGGTAIEAINKVGSLLYGPIFAAFFLGILTRWATPLAVKAGVTTGLLLNVFLWRKGPDLSWLWWNATGMLSALVTAFVISKFLPGESRALSLDPEEPSRVNWRVRYIGVTVYFLAILLFCAWLQARLIS